MRGSQSAFLASWVLNSAFHWPGAARPMKGLAAPFVPLARSVLEEEIFFARKNPQKLNNKYLLMRITTQRYVGM